MQSHPDIRLNKLVAECGSWTLTSQAFMRYLGLPIKEKERPRGHPKFDDATGQVAKFYKSTIKMVNVLCKTHENLDDLKKTVFPVSEQHFNKFTDESLSPHGHLIWPESGIRPTRITEDYPRFLEYTNFQDYCNIRTCVYHWIVHRAIRKFLHEGTKSNFLANCNSETPRSVTVRDSGSHFRQNISDSEDSGDETYVQQEENNTTENTNGAAETANGWSNGADSDSNRAGVHASGMRLETSFQPGNPPLFFLEPSSSPSVACQVNVTGLSQEAGPYSERGLWCNTTSASLSQPGMTNSNPTNLTSSGQLEKKRKMFATPQEPTQGMKKPCSIGFNAANPNLQSRRDSSFTEIEYRALLEGSPAEHVPLNTPLTSHIQGATARKRPWTLVRETAPNPEIESASGSERDSVLDTNENEDRENYVEESQSPSLDTELRNPRPSLIVVLKVNTRKGSNDSSEAIHMKTPTKPHVPSIPAAPSPVPSPHIPSFQIPLPQISTPQLSPLLDRGLLTSKLHDLLESPEAGTQNIETLRDTIEYITRITKNDAVRLKDEFGDSFEQHEDFLNRWLGCASDFVQFRQITDFKGDKSHWATFFRALPPEKKTNAMKAFLRTRTTIFEWRIQPGFTVAKVSRELAHVLFHITTWEDMIGLEEMETLCTVFNERLLAWFD